MRHFTWQVGLDIQNGYARAIAVQKRRSGWQLRHWWQQPLPQDIMRQGILHETEQLIVILSRWQQCLPVTISLRICLPAERIIQLRLPTPDNRLQEPHRDAFIRASAAKKLPLAIESLMIDYRSEPCDDRQLVITAARQQEIEQWQHCLAQARLFPEAIDLTPCAIQHSACAAGVPAESLLLHQLGKQWLWVAPHGLPFQFGLLEEDEVPGPDQWRERLFQMYSASKLCNEAIYFSSTEQDRPPEGMQSWSPFSAFTQMSPPLPVNPAAFAIAAGLALRPVEH